jgi:hypothetical protein
VFQNSRLSGGGVTGYVPTVYQDAACATPFASNVVTANAYGQFPVVYFPPVGLLRVQLFNAAGQLLGDVDPFVPTSRFDVTAVSSFATLLVTPFIAALPTPRVFIPYPGTYRFKSVLNFSAISSVGGVLAPFFTTLLGINNRLNSASTAGAYRDAFSSSYILVGSESGGTIASGGYMSNASTEANAPSLVTVTFAIGNNQIEMSGVFTCTAPGVIGILAAEAGASQVNSLPGGYLQVQKLQ